MTDHARRERRLLADLLLARGPDAPTLCEGWTTRDLAAHIVVRDRRPDAAAGILVPALSGYTERIRLTRAALPYPELVEQLRTPPALSPLNLPVLDGLVNTLEFFVHHEDVRRADPRWEPRELTADEQAALWRTGRFTARAGLRRLKISATVRPAGQAPVRTGPDPRVEISGEAGEVALFFFGRQRATRVRIDGDPDLAHRLRTARLGV